LLVRVEGEAQRRGLISDLKEHPDQFANSDPDADKERPCGYSQRDQEQDIPAASRRLLKVIRRLPRG
jgi:hypothetical protein